MITFERQPEAYRHWRLSINGRIATLALDVDEEAGLAPGYKLKLNSYDLGVDIELHDALQRIRFEHPQVACIVLTSGKERMFCAGANIYMLGASTHGWKVNFCKFTNETRNGMEDSSRHDGLKFLAAINGSCAGGGYEVALACDEILMVNDRSTAVSLPEAPLLGVLPGTGGLTRLVDKRKVRRDLADLFCTSADGVRSDRAMAWGLIDDSATPNRFPELVRSRAEALAASSQRPADAHGVILNHLERAADEHGLKYRYVEVNYERPERRATITVRSPHSPSPQSAEEILALGDQWWPLAMGRELDDAILSLRTNEPNLGLWVLKTEGSAEAVLSAGRALVANPDDWFVRETIGFLRRTFARLEVSSRSLYALIDSGSCFAGVLFELALAADRSYMLSLIDDGQDAPTIVLDETNLGLLPAVDGRSRLETRFFGDPSALDEARSLAAQALDAEAAQNAGLITVASDELDWDDEIRLALEERVSLSPDALTGMEASLRFPGAETLQTKVFGRLSAWQNWVFNRPNATGERGALKLFGSGAKPHFNWERV
ncbi:MAG TPA: 2,3-epoxybenzoyl-CoA dihydrolase [Caulobacteraceae bacterium]|nr:2,3-epoxybenzoyl-CoA dihydrolase [Caulobacteraceae bacterium]